MSSSSVHARRRADKRQPDPWNRSGESCLKRAFAGRLIGSVPFSKSAQREIAAFKGVPPDASRAVHRHAVPLDNLLGVVFEQYRIEKPTVEKALMGSWREIMGPQLAHRTSPVKLLDNGKVLMIGVGSATLRQELQFQSKDILKRIQAQPGCEGIQSLQFRAG
ncbi:MAG: DUF721 domain-containing protein [Opitutales bacterium]